MYSKARAAEMWQWVNHAKTERQAEEFVAWLLGGPKATGGMRHTSLPFHMRSRTVLTEPSGKAIRRMQSRQIAIDVEE